VTELPVDSTRNLRFPYASEILTQTWTLAAKAALPTSAAGFPGASLYNRALRVGRRYRNQEEPAPTSKKWVRDPAAVFPDRPQAAVPKDWRTVRDF